MKFYNKKTQEFLIINRKEDLTEDLISVTDEEQFKIVEALNDGRHVYFDENNEIRISQAKPSNYHYWSEKYKEWKVNEELKYQYLKEAREEVWSKIQEVRDNHQSSGVYVESLGKWFHTDQSAIINYLSSQLFVNLPDWEEKWKTMDGEGEDQYVLLNKEKFQEVISQVYKKCKLDFYNAEKHRLALLESEDPYSYDYSTGWTPSFYQS